MRKIINLNGQLSYKPQIRDTGLVAPIMQYDRDAADSDVVAGYLMAYQQLRDSNRMVHGNGLINELDLAYDNALSNQLILSNQGAFGCIVDGDCVVVTSKTATSSEKALGTTNRVIADLLAPPSSGTRYDLVFLEVWYSEVVPSVQAGDDANANKIPYFGNYDNTSDWGGSILQNPSVGVETIHAVQRRYRIRTATHPSMVFALWLGDIPGGVSIPAQAGAASPLSSAGSTWNYTFYNPTADVVGNAGYPGDPLAVAGDGSASAATAMKSVDGYSYAIPLCIVARTAGRAYVQESDVFGIPWALMHGGNASTVNGYGVSGTPTAGKMLVLDQNAKIPATSIPNSSIQTYHLGNGIPTLAMRFGLSNDTDWNQPGNVQEATGPVKMACGAAEALMDFTTRRMTISITFGAGNQFDVPPLLIVTPGFGYDIDPILVYVSNVTTTGATIGVVRLEESDSSTVSYTVNWLAIGANPI